MKKMMAVTGALLLLAGCTTEDVGFSANVAATYLAAHQDRPAPIKDALSVGKLAEGMKEEEVRICWGDADSVKEENNAGLHITYWAYVEPQAVAHAGRMGGGMQDALVKDAKFTNGVLRAWRDLRPAK